MGTLDPIKDLILHPTPRVALFAGIFADAAALATALPIGLAGLYAYATAEGSYYFWDVVGAAWAPMTSGGGDATSIGGVPVDLTGIQDGDVLAYSAAGPDFLPVAQSGGGGWDGLSTNRNISGPATLATTDFRNRITNDDNGNTLTIPENLDLAFPVTGWCYIVLRPSFDLLVGGTNVTVNGANPYQTRDGLSGRTQGMLLRTGTNTYNLYNL
jgi:hypothetical protein